MVDGVGDTERAAGGDKWWHLREVLAERTKAPLVVDQGGATVVGSVRLGIARAADRAQADRDLSAISACWNCADELLAEIGRLRAALAWYADELNYDRLVGDMPGTPSPVLVDGGKHARAALAPDGAPETAAPMAQNRAETGQGGPIGPAGRSVPVIAPDRAVAPEIERRGDA